MLRKLCALAVMTVALPAAVLATSGEKTPVALIFESHHLDQLSRGRQVTYRYEHKVSDERLLGQDYADDIRLGVLKVDEAGKRDVTMSVFSGPRARDPWKETGLTLNPVFVWYLNNSVSMYRMMSGGDHNYLKDRFSRAYLEKYKVEELKADFQGQPVDAYKVTIAPYEGDPAAKKMQGYEVSTFSVIFSPKVPGYFLELTANIESKKKGSPSIAERVSLVNVGDMP